MSEETLEQCEREKAYVIQNYKQLQTLYGSDYLAIRNQQVIDHDKNEFALAKRMEENFRNQFVLIDTLEGILNPKQDSLPSPEERE